MAFLISLACAQTLEVPGYEKIPLRLGDEGHLLMSSRIKGQKIVFVVDTGAPTGILDREKARALGLKPENEFGDGRREETVILSDLMSGNVRLGNISIAVGDSLPQRQRTFYRGEADVVHGLLGSDILARHAAIIDFRNRILFLRRAPETQAMVATQLGNTRYVPVPFRNSRWLYAPVQLRGRKFSAIVDTGSAVTILRSRTIARLGVRSKNSMIWVRGLGIAPRRLRLVQNTDHSLTVGDTPIRTEFHVMPGADFFGKQPRDFIGILGNDLLIHHGAVIDYGHNTLWLLPD
ncbi:MAG TPA: aspartyl protease family protein [Chthoniobacterales bacterium]